MANDNTQHRHVAYNASVNFNYMFYKSDRQEFYNTQRHREVVRQIYQDLFGHDGLRYHDFAKQIMIFLFGDDIATWFHRFLSPHHENFRFLDWVFSGKKVWDGTPIDNIIEACIDWQSARFTKPDKPLDAYQTWKKYYRHADAPEVEQMYIGALQSLQRLAEQRGLLQKWGTWWDYSDPETNS
jgi:hypothetical protein